MARQNFTGSACLEQRETATQDAQKGRPARPQAEQDPEVYPQGYVEDSCELRTPLADFFSILLVRLLGTVKADDKLDRTMVGFAATAGAGDLGFPVCGFVVKSAECFSAPGDRRPGFAGFGDIGHEAAYGEGDVAALRGLSLRHTETTRLFCRGV